MFPSNSLSSLPLYLFFLLCGHTNGNRTVTALRSGKWRPYGCNELFHCPPPTAFVDGPWEPDKQWEWLEGWGLHGGGQETENRKPCPQGDRKEVNMHRLSGDCGQVVEIVEWKPGSLPCSWRLKRTENLAAGTGRLLTINLKNTHAFTHTHTLECHDLFSNPVGNRVLGMHLPTYSVSSGCDQYALCDCG